MKLFKRWQRNKNGDEANTTIVPQEDMPYTSSVQDAPVTTTQTNTINTTPPRVEINLAHTTAFTAPLNPAQKRKQKQELFRAINQCKELLRDPFLRESEMQALYRNGAAFQLMQSESMLLHSLPTLLPNLSAQQHTQIENFEFSLELLQEKKAQLDTTLPPFLVKEEKLKTDIQAFTKAVKETQTRHKLSPDWDGKKPALMNLGDILQERRNQYNQEEEQLNTRMQKLYAMHAEFYQAFALFCEEIVPQLEAEFGAAMH